MCFFSTPEPQIMYVPQATGPASDSAKAATGAPPVPNTTTRTDQPLTPTQAVSKANPDASSSAAAANAASKNEGQRRMAAARNNSTMLTGPTGLASTAVTDNKPLLGR